MLAEARRVGADAARLAAAPLGAVPDAEFNELILAAHHIEQAGAVMQARLVQHAGTHGIHSAQGHRTTTAWLRSLLLDPHPAKELAGWATALHRPAVEQAVLDGRVDLRQAFVISSACDAIPKDLADLGDVGDVTTIVDQAEATLIDLAQQFPAYQLRRIGERILAHVAPHLAEQAEAAALNRQEARNHERRGFTLGLPSDGLVRLSGHLGTEDADIVKAALNPLCKPQPDDDRSPAQRRADALVDICRLALRTTELPVDGGEPPQVTLTIGYDPLTKALGTAYTDTGERLSATTARRMACDARILPAVLGSQGEILDVGRSQRLATRAIRRALHLRDGGCAFPGCDRPARWTDCHHALSWHEGGTTCLSNLVLLCRRHHRLMHHPTAGWRIQFGTDQRPEFIPPKSIDPEQKPRRNLYHLRL